jgi:putative intracellular protease/amidase
MWDLAESTDSIALIESFYNSGKPVALVCHSPGVLHRVTYKGAPIVKGKRVTGFTNGEKLCTSPMLFRSSLRMS